MRGLSPANQLLKSKIKNLKSKISPPHPSPLPQRGEGTKQCPSPPRGRRWPSGRMRGLSPAIQLLKSKIKNQKSKISPPHPSPLPQRGEGTVAKCPSPPRGRRWPSGRMRGPDSQLNCLLPTQIENRKSKISNQPPPHPLRRTGEGTAAN